jgi:hypothetical protein
MITKSLMPWDPSRQSWHRGHMRRLVRNIALSVTVALVIVAHRPAFGQSDPASSPASVSAEDDVRGNEIIQIKGKRITIPGIAPLTVDAGTVSGAAGANNDALRALTSTPSVSRLPFSFGGIALRGASIRNTAVKVDDVPLPLPFHFGGVTSIFPTEAMSKISLYSGNYPVMHSRAVGGIVVIESRPPRNDRFRFGFDLSPLHVQLYAEGPLGKPVPTNDATSNRNPWVVWIGARRSFLDAVLRPFVKAETPLPSYLDAQLIVGSGQQRWWGGIKPMIIVGQDSTSSPTLALSLAVGRAVLPWQLRSQRTAVHLSAWAGTTQVDFRGDLTPDEMTQRVHVVRDQTEWGVVASGTRYLGALELQAGGDVLVGNLTGSTGVPNEPGIPLRPRTWKHAGAWANATIAGKHGSLVPGVRVDHMGLSDETIVSPRINGNLRLTPQFELVAAAGAVAEPPLAADIGLPGGDSKPAASRSRQYSVAARADLASDLSVEITGYYHESERLPVITDRNVFNTVSRNSFSPLVLEIVQQYLGEGTPRQAIGMGRAYGIETLLRYAHGKHGVQLAHTWSRSLRTELPAFYQGYHPYVLDQPNRLHVSWQYQGERWLLSSAFHFATGLAYSPTSVTEFGTVKQELWADRLPDFAQLDVRVERRWPNRGGTWSVYLDVQNVTARENVESIRAALANENGVPVLTTSRITGLPFVPFLGVKYVPR